jgi:hypothetical protein
MHSKRILPPTLSAPMPHFLTLAAVFLFASTVTASATPPAGACVTPYGNGQYFRELRHSGASRIWLASHGGQVDLCVALAPCAWRIANVPISLLGDFEDLAGPAQRCTSKGSVYWDGETRHSDCEMPVQFVTRLTAAERWLANIGGNAACESASSVGTGFIFASAGGVPFLVLQTESSPMCLTIGIPLGPDDGAFAFLSLSCSPSAELERKTSPYAAATIDHRPAGFWIGAAYQGGGFAVMGDSAGAADATVATWGDALNFDVVRAWLARVTSAAGKSEKLATDSDPLPLANGTEYSGRLAKWLTAGLRRVAYRPFSPEWRVEQRARDWMVLNALKRLPAFEGTLLRGESARTDWHK